MTIKYHDVSHYNGAYVPTGPTCAKATEGTLFVDSQYAGIRARTLAGGWPFLAYHYLRTTSVAAQAAHVVDVIGHGKPIMLDVEANSGSISNVLAFMDAYKAAGGMVTLVYLPHWYWSSIGSPSLTGIKARGAGLVSSNYTTYSDTGPGWNAYGGMTPIIWQYTSTPIDTNAFKGTQAELAQLWANGTNPPEEDMAFTAQDVVDALVKDPNFLHLIWRVDGMASLRDTYPVGAPADMAGDPVPFTKAVKAIPTTAVPAAPIDYAALAKAVNDDAARRLQS